MTHTPTAAASSQHVFATRHAAQQFANLRSIGRTGGDQVYIQETPEFKDVFCPGVGWTVARDGFCFDCGATDHMHAAS